MGHIRLENLPHTCK